MCLKLKAGKLETPLSTNQGRGAAKSGPNILLIWKMFKVNIQPWNLAQDIIIIMQQAVAICPKISISSKGVQIPSLLDSGSKVSLIHQSYCKEHLLSKIETPTGEKADAHILFNLTTANDG